MLSSCSGQKNNTVVVNSGKDSTITSETAFSKLFLDSTQLEDFLKKEVSEGNAGTQMRNFYKSRNYQYAWFTENGIAEHTRSFWSLHHNYITDFSDTSLKYMHLHGDIENVINHDTSAVL